ncbi:MAG: dienelactone hydrolase family protein, partial [Sphingobacteriales bacterium]
MKKTILLLSIFMTSLIWKAQAQIKTQTIDYKDGETALEGYLAYDESVKGKRPAVLVVHEWMGITDYTKKRCEELAKMGYIAFAPDIYGKGIRPTNMKEAGAQAGKYKGDRNLMRSRVNAGLNWLQKQENVDTKKIAAIGYCFGGTTVLELARSGANILGVVSFHGGLDNPKPEDAKNIKAKVLVCHGAIDPNVPQEQVNAFMKEMNDAKVDYQFIAYSGAVHAFTNPAASHFSFCPLANLGITWCPGCEVRGCMPV